MTPPPNSLPNGHALAVTGLRAGYPTPGGEVPVLHSADLTVANGELLAILGPSGCGKTTMLRVLAGLMPAGEGRVELGGRVVVDGTRMVPPELRHVGLVPQDAALFPHRDVAANIGFGLRPRRRWRTGRQRNADRRRRRVAEMLDLIGMADYAHRYPHELSGGQRQRVALARALAPEPALVLLDEAFGALDASLRSRLRFEVRDILKLAGTAAILVTHDQDEALSIADRVAVMHEGRIIQIGPPAAVYSEPADAWVARFLGDCTLLSATSDGTRATCSLGAVEACIPAGPARVLVRPELVRITVAPGHADGAVPARVTGHEYRGHSTLYRLRLDRTGEELTARGQDHVPHPEGTHVLVSLRGAGHVLAGT